MGYVILLQSLLGLSVLIISMSLGKLMLSYYSDYQPIASLFKTESSFGFNALYRILIAPVCIVFASIVLYSIGADGSVANIWLVAVWYFVMQLALLLFLENWKLVNKPRFFLYHSISIALTYYIYQVLIVQGLDHLLPDEANLRTDMWLIIAAFLYSIFRGIPENDRKSQRRKNKYVLSRYTHYSKQFTKQLDKYDPLMQQVLISIMIYESFNRPRVIRKIEDLLKRKTRGIMQVNGAHTDSESILKAAKILQPSYKILKAIEAGSSEHQSALHELFRSYNPGDQSYAHEVLDIYQRIGK